MISKEIRFENSEVLTQVHIITKLEIDKRHRQCNVRLSSYVSEQGIAENRKPQYEQIYSFNDSVFNTNAFPDEFSLNSQTENQDYVSIIEDLIVQSNPLFQNEEEVQ